MNQRIVLREVSKVYPLENNSGHDPSSPTSKVNTPDSLVAVADVSLSIGHGERLGIVGRNGAGKSTLLHMIAGLSAPTSGSINVTGRITSVMTLGVGLRDDLSGRENIYIDGEIQGKSRYEIEPHIEAIVAFADLGEFIDFPVRTYSTGMKSRLAFAMISHIDPEILVIDEALSVGDASFSAKATTRIKEICAKGKIVILVSHAMQSIRDICNRCLWMDAGRVVMDGSPDVVTQAYIDSVRAADESELMVKFRKYIGNRSVNPEWVIREVAIFNGQSGERRTLLESEQPTRLEIRAVAPMGKSQCMLRVRITRIDDLIVFDEAFAAVDYALSERSVGLEIELTPFVLGPAVYRLDVTLESGESVCASSSSIFEVFALNAPIGGKPTLLYPVTATVLPANLV